MSLLKSKIITFSFVVGFVGLLLLANTAIGVTPPPEPVAGVTVTGLVDILESIVRWVYTIFFVIAVLLILMAAFTYLTAGGDAEKISKAKNQLIYAVVAIVVALLAYGFNTIIRTFLTTRT